MNIEKYLTEVTPGTAGIKAAKADDIERSSKRYLQNVELTMGRISDEINDILSGWDDAVDNSLITSEKYYHIRARLLEAKKALDYACSQI